MNRDLNRDNIKRNNWVDQLAYLLDEKFRFPGTNFRFGLDPILNLIPVAGDVTGFLISAGLLLTLAKRGASQKVVILMTINIVLDFIIGGIPILGQIFDFFFKANKRNIRLLKEHYVEGKHQGSGKGVLAIVGIVLVVIFILFIYLIWNLFEWVISLF
jgi:hypothetical protein